MNTRLFKTGDKILIIGVAVIALAFMLWNTMGNSNGQKTTAVVTQNGRLVRQIDLTSLKDREYIRFNGDINQVIVAERGRIRFLDSDCPNQTCVKTGWLTRPRDKAACIPSRVVVTIVGGSEQVDVFSY